MKTLGVSQVRLCWASHTFGWMVRLNTAGWLFARQLGFRGASQASVPFMTSQLVDFQTCLFFDIFSKVGQAKQHNDGLRRRRADLENTDGVNFYTSLLQFVLQPVTQRRCGAAAGFVLLPFADAFGCQFFFPPAEYLQCRPEEVRCSSFLRTLWFLRS